MATALIVLAACSDGGGEGSATSTSLPAATTTRAAGERLPLPTGLHVGPGRVIVDGEGRQVLLRGVNVNSLGEYDRADPDLREVAPIGDQDWDAMAGLGFSVVRLIVSWSQLEPERGEFDTAYVARVRAAVRAAAERGIATVVDVHQDAWGIHIRTPEGHECPAGLERAIGWDGAPAWATLTDGAETCRPPGTREGSAAVKAAFRSFYANRDGIRDRFVATWQRLAEALADEPGLAGFDLLNEPTGVLPAAEQEQAYTALLTATIAAVRAGEAQAGTDPHLIFIEPIPGFPLPGTTPTAGFSDDPNLVFAPHNYAEAIGPAILSIEQTIDIDRSGAEGQGMALWIGEYGWWDTAPETVAKLDRYAAAEDEAVLGGAWWQWRQACGDPHSIGVPGNVPGDQIHLNGTACPSGRDLGMTEPFASVLSRAYPRAAPGRVTELRSDPETGRFRVAATGATTGRELVVWVPDGAGAGPTPKVEGLGPVATTKVEGGRLLVAPVTAASYSLSI